MSTSNDTAVIRASDLQMRFRRTNALRGVNLNIQPGTVFALLGENGAGKTTFIRILTGFQKPTSGRVSVCGVNPIADPGGVRRRIGYVSDNPALYRWMTVAQIGGFAGSLYDESFLSQYRRSIQRYEINPAQKIKHLSKGQRAKVALSLALAHDPSLLVLDEPTSGLDPKVRKSFLESMIDRAATGQTVFLSSHQIAEVERVADRIAILHHGKICLDESIETLRDSVSQVTVDVDDSLRALPSFPNHVEVLSEQTSGRQRQSIVKGLIQPDIDWLTNQEGVTDVRQRTASLEEVFVACTSDDERTNENDSSLLPGETSENNLAVSGSLEGGSRL